MPKRWWLVGLLAALSLECRPAGPLTAPGAPGAELRPGVVIERTLAGREVHSPNGSFGPERVAFEAGEDGTFRVEVASLESTAARGAYDLRLENVLSPEEAARFRLTEVTRADLERWVGNYELAPGHVVMIGLAGGIYVGKGKPVLVLTDLKDRTVGALHPASPTRLLLGRDLIAPDPVAVELELALGTDGRATGLRWLPREGAPIAARLVDGLRLENVAFENGEVTLRGYLLTPGGPGPFPAVVYAHGSQAATGEVGTYGNFFVRKGLAFLSFDKRGAGRSSGDWKTASLETLASDVLAGAAFLRRRPGIDPTRVGIWGVSQGGWVGSIATARSKEIAFFISQVGSGVAVADNMVQEARGPMRRAGLSPAALEQAAAFLRKVYWMMAEGASLAQIEEVAKAIAGQPWAAFIESLRVPPQHYIWQWMRLNGRVDSIPFLRRIRQPVLWLLGDRDQLVPSAVSEPRIRDALREAGNPDFTIRVLSPASHGLREVATGPEGDEGIGSRFVAGYWETLGAWLDAKVLGRR
jgi:dienelactone hydrolase